MLAREIGSFSYIIVKHPSHRFSYMSRKSFNIKWFLQTIGRPAHKSKGLATTGQLREAVETLDITASKTFQSYMVLMFRPCQNNGWKAHCEPIKVGWRGFASKYLHRLLKRFGICGLHKQKELKNVSQWLWNEEVVCATWTQVRAVPPPAGSAGESVWCKTQNILWTRLHHWGCAQVAHKV